MKKDITYFERPGKINTPRVIKLAKMRAGEPGIADIIVASLTGESALKVAEVFGEQMNIVCVRFIPGASWSVTDEYGAYDEIPELLEIKREWVEKGLERIPIEFSPGIEDELRRRKVKVIGGTPTLWNVDRSLMKKFGGFSLAEVMNETLRLFCPGARVCIEITLMAADAGAVPTNSEAIALAGTERGLDTAIVIKPSLSTKIFDRYDGLEIREFICKPRSMVSRSGRFIGR